MFESMEARVAGLGDALAGVLGDLDPDAVSAASAEDLWSGFDRLERLASAGKTLLARRAAQSPPPAAGPGAGMRSGVERLAARSGCGVGAAREAVETSKRLSGGAAAGVAAALRRGELSAPQAAAVSSAVEADPSAEGRLVDLAGRVSLPELRDECARVRAAADPDPAARNARLHRARRLRRFTDAEGAWQLLARGTPQAGAAFNAVLEPLVDQVFRAARRDGRHEPVEAYAFDALMAMADRAAGDTHPGVDGVARSTGTPGGTAECGRTGGDAAGHEGDGGTDQGGAHGLNPDVRDVGSRSADDRGRERIGDADAHGRERVRETSAAPQRNGVAHAVDPSATRAVAPPPAAAPSVMQREAPWWAAARGVLLGGGRADDDEGPSADGGQGCCGDICRGKRGGDCSGDCGSDASGGCGTGAGCQGDGRVFSQFLSASAAPWWATAHLLGDPPGPAGTGDEGSDGARGSVSQRLVVPVHVAGRPFREDIEDPTRDESSCSDPARSTMPDTATGAGQSGLPPSVAPPPPPHQEAHPPTRSPAVGAGPSAPPPEPESHPPTRTLPLSPSSGQHVPRNPRHLALLRVDLAALHRGSVQGGEMCEIAGVGPVPVEVARGLLGDAVLKLVITRGVDVLNVTHLGRGPTAAQRVALAWQSPTCAVEGCWRRRVEIDHREEWARTRHTRLDELDPLCAQHHDLKTRFGWALVRGTGKRPFVPPADSRHPRHQQHHDGRAGGTPGPGDTHRPRDTSGPCDTPGPDDTSRPDGASGPDGTPAPDGTPGLDDAAGRTAPGRPVRPAPGDAVGSRRPGQALAEDTTTAGSGTGPPPGEPGAARAGTSVTSERARTSVGRERRGHRRSAVTAPLFEDGLP